MKDFGIFFFTVFALIGICLVLGLLTRNTEKNEKDRDDMMHTLGRGLGFFIVIVTGISIIGGIIYLLFGD